MLDCKDMPMSVSAGIFYMSRLSERSSLIEGLDHGFSHAELVTMKFWPTSSCVKVQSGARSGQQVGEESITSYENFIESPHTPSHRALIYGKVSSCSSLLVLWFGPTPTPLLATKEAAEPALAFGSGLLDILVKLVNGLVHVLASVSAEFLDLLLGLGSVCLRLGVQLSGLRLGILELSICQWSGPKRRGKVIKYSAVHLLTSLLSSEAYTLLGLLSLTRHATPEA